MNAQAAGWGSLRFARWSSDYVGFQAQEDHRQSALVRNLWQNPFSQSPSRRSIATESIVDEGFISATVLVDRSPDGVGNLEDAIGPQQSQRECPPHRFGLDGSPHNCCHGPHRMPLCVRRVVARSNDRARHFVGGGRSELSARRAEFWSLGFTLSPVCGLSAHTSTNCCRVDGSICTRPIFCTVDDSWRLSGGRSDGVDHLRLH